MYGVGICPILFLLAVVGCGGYIARICD
jgi:hypothetical protein